MSADFIKLYPGFFLGTISRETCETRLCFVAMLLLADENGVVRITKDALGRYVGIDESVACTAVDRLLLPDPDSTSPDEDGRRIVPWGDGQNTYRVVNYRHYFEKSRNEERKEYKREWDRQNASTRFNRKTNKPRPTKSDKSDPENESESENESLVGAKPPTRLETDCERVMLHYNRLAERRFIPTGHQGEGIRARLKEGATAEDLILICDHKASQWLNDPAMVKNFNPVTLYRPKHFERYLDDAQRWNAGGRTGKKEGRKLKNWND